MPNALNAIISQPQRILCVGPVGSGKTAQIITLPGRKFVYIFEPNALNTLRGYDLDYEEFLVTPTEMDPMLKGFNKDSSDDKLGQSGRPKLIGGKAPEPVQMLRWVDHFNNAYDRGFFLDFDWLCFDSLTLFKEILMDRQMFLNKRFGAIEDRADYRIAGAKIVEIFQMLASLPINLYCTGHLNEFEDEKTKKVKTQLDIPGSSRRGLPMLFANIWETAASTDTEQKYIIKTRAEPRGFQDIRTSIRGLQPQEDITIKGFDERTKLFMNPGAYGIGALLKKHNAIPQLAEQKKSAREKLESESKTATESPQGKAAPTSASASSPKA